MSSLSRRHLMEYAAKSFLGVTFLPQLLSAAPSDPKDKRPAAKRTDLPPGKAKRAIYLYMSGAMSHLDSFDLKPGREVQGETKPISTKVSGMQFGAALPKLAELANHLAVVRSLHTETGDHDQGRYLMRTSYKEIASIRHPSLGSWIQKARGPRGERSLPDNVVIGGDARHPGAGFLDPAFTPVPIGDPRQGLQNTKQPEYLKEDSLERRMKLIDAFDADFRKAYPQKQVEAYNEFYRQARQLMSSSDLKAFDISKEDAKVRDAYGSNAFGMGCLLARRLIEADTRFVEVNLGGWDNHVDIKDAFPRAASTLDTAMAALINDLNRLGLLGETIVVLATEFGRTPKINQNNGRDHHPGVFSSVLAGGGIKGGQFYGTSDKDGHSPDKDPVSIGDFNSTIAQALGLPLNEEFFSKSGRPFKIGHDGKPIAKLFG